jgi:hypothetical protein
LEKFPDKPKTWTNTNTTEIYASIGLLIAAGALKAKRLLANPGGDVEKGILKILLERYPEAEELITPRDNEAKIEYVVRKTETITSRGEKQNKRKYVYILPYDAKAEPDKDTKELCIFMSRTRKI